MCGKRGTERRANRSEGESWNTFLKLGAHPIL